METNKAGFEIETCSRCAGSGNYSFCQTHGTRCFKCHGIGKTHTKKGAAAQAYYTASLDKPVIEIQVGDSVLATVGMMGPKKWFKVAAIKPDTLNAGRISLDLTRPSKKYDHGYGTFLTSTLPSVRNEEERLQKLAQAIAYQATLTKAGKVAKKHAVAA